MNLLHLATPDDIERLDALVAAFHAYGGVNTSVENRQAALELLFSGEVQAAAWLIGPRRAPVGYVVISFGFSIELGGRDAFVDELYVREAVRGRGMGSQALYLLAPKLREMGVKALHLEVDRDNSRARAFYERAHFAPRDEYHLMTRLL